MTKEVTKLQFRNTGMKSKVETEPARQIKGIIQQ